MTELAGRQSVAREQRERIELLLDPGSLLELDRPGRLTPGGSGRDMGSSGDVAGLSDGGVITGLGTIEGRPVCVFSHDADLLADGSAEVAGRKIIRVIDLALKTGCPLIGIYAGGVQPGQGRARGTSLGAYAEILRRSAHASGVIPQLSLVLGEMAGEQAFGPVLSDFVIMVEQTSQLYAGGPEVIASVTGEKVTVEEVGGGRMHATVSGTAHYLAADEADAIAYLQDLLSYLPQNNLEDPPGYDGDGESGANEEPAADDLTLDMLVPKVPSQPYDMVEAIIPVLDDGEFCAVQKLYAPNIVVGYGRIDGRVVGVVANQPLHFAGCLDINAAEKAARFIRTCDAFNTPVITFVDVPGFLPGTDQEWSGILRRGAKLIYGYAEATVPLITVITRQGYGNAYELMGSKQLGADITLAWPTAAGSGVGYIDAVIAPHETRAEIMRALRLLRTKRESLPPKKHGNIPL